MNVSSKIVTVHISCGYIYWFKRLDVHITNGEQTHCPCGCRFPPLCTLSSNQALTMKTTSSSLWHASWNLFPKDNESWIESSTLKFPKHTKIPPKRLNGLHVSCSYNFTKPSVDSSHIRCTLIRIWWNLHTFRRVHPKPSDSV